MQRARTAALGGALALLAVPLGLAPAAGHGDGHEGGGVGEVTVIADGLDSPRGLALDRRDDVWFAQSGRGGDGPCFSGPEGPTCLGATGKISMLRDDDRRRGSHGDVTVVDVVTGLPSVAQQGSGRNAVGPSDVAFERGNRLLATIGLGGDPAVRDLTGPGGLGTSPLADALGTVAQVDLHRGGVTTLADIGAFELTVNPEPTDADTNPYSIAARGHQRLVADAGGNALLSIDRHGGVETVAVFPPEAPVQIPGAPAGAMIEPDPVPNTVVRGPDGAFYVGQLTGFPFVPGTATVWRVRPGEEPTVYADGFTNIIDLAFDDEGDLLVLEIAHHGLLTAFGTGDWTGALIEVPRRDPGRRTVLLEAPLFAPGGIVVDDDVAFISNRSTVPGEGQILRVELDD